jgi:rhomboid protease GluP
VVTALVLACEFAFGSEPLRGVVVAYRTLDAFGGLDGEFVQQGQWWRLFTAPLLHNSALHFLLNGIVLLIVGGLLEPLIGTRWFAAIFVGSALGGALAATAWNEPRVLSTGIAPANLAVVCAALVYGFAKSGEHAAQLRRRALGALIPALIPALLALWVGTTPDAALLGGAVAGGVFGYVFVAIWPLGLERPLFEGVAVAIVLLSAAASFSAFGLAAAQMSNGASDLIPDVEAPRDEHDGVARAADLVARYPKDPRGHFYRAVHFIQILDAADAEEQLRIALAGQNGAARMFPDRFWNAVRVALAGTLLYEHRAPEAKAIAAPACAQDAATTDRMVAAIDQQLRYGTLVYESAPLGSICD